MLRWLYFQIVFAVAMVAPSVAGTGFLDTPDSCLSVQDVRGTAVYLHRVGKCDGKPGRVFVEANPGEQRELVVDGRLVGKQQVKGLEVADVTGVLDRADKLGQGFKIPANSHAADMQKAAEQTKAVYDSEEFQAKLQAEQERIATASMGDQFGSYYKDAEGGSGSFGKLGSDERLYIFVSASMPMHVLRQYAADAAKLHDSQVSLVFRGFVGGMSKIAPTAHMIAEMLKKNPSCELSASTKCDMQRVEVIVDPLLYRRYGVQQVPTFVYAKGVKPTNPDMSEGDASNTKQSGETFSLTGDASLKFVVTKLSEEAGGDSLKGAVAKLR